MHDVLIATSSQSAHRSAVKTIFGTKQL